MPISRILCVFSARCFWASWIYIWVSVTHFGKCWLLLLFQIHLFCFFSSSSDIPIRHMLHLLILPHSLKINFFNPHLRICSLILEREREREREKHWCEKETSICFLLTGYQTHNLSVRPDWESNLQPLRWAGRLSTQLSHTAGAALHFLCVLVRCLFSLLI